MKYVIRFVAILVAAGAVWYFYLRDQGDEVEEVVVVLDPVQEYLSLNDAPAYINLGSVVAPIFKDNEATGSLIAVVVLEITSASLDEDVRDQMAVVKDALLAELYGASEQLATYGVEPNLVEIKQRFLAASERVLGEEVVADILLQDFVYRYE